MNEKDFWDGNVIKCWKAVFKETIDDYIICDVYMGGAQYVNIPSELVLTLGKKKNQTILWRGRCKNKVRYK